MTKLILSTGNVVSGGPSIIRKPGTFRSNLELTSSLRNNFAAAKQDYAETPARTNGHTNGDAAAAAAAAPLTNGANGAPNGVHNGGPHHPHHPHHTHHRPPPPAGSDAWTERDGDALYVPRISWAAAGLREERGEYDLTVKLFFLPGAPVNERARYIDEALALVRKELGVSDVDLLIASFPGMSFEGDCEWAADKRNAQQGDLEDEVATWGFLEGLHEEGTVRQLGIAEFGSEKLEKFISKVRVRPAVDQINIRDCCKVPPPLAKLAKEQGIELFVHTDCTDILPKGTVRELLGQGVHGAGVLADSKDGGEGLRGEIVPLWVVKYTAFIRDRGVIENKGYFAAAEVRDG